MLVCPECGERTWTYDRVRGVRICKQGHRTGGVEFTPPDVARPRRVTLALAAVGGLAGGLLFKLAEAAF
jgi:hypothetical protein